MRLIDADDCKDLMYVMCAGQDKSFVRAMEQVIDDCPEVNAAIVVHSKWIEKMEEVCVVEERVAECESCGDSHILDEWTIDEFKRFYLFCPNCGAKMDG